MLCFLLLALFANAAEDPRTAALKAADDERVAAIIAADRARLTAIFSDDLRYAHSNGAIDTKSTYTESLVSGKMKYEVIDYEERTISILAPGVGMISGRIHVKATSASGKMDIVLAILSVWREENGKWRFLAYQSAKVPPPTPAAK